MNRRKETKGLDTDTMRDLWDGWHFARKIGRPLNAMVTIRPVNVDDLSPEERCALWAMIRNKLGVYARQRGFGFTAIWSRECNRDGTGEHLHVLVHVPPRHREHFEATVYGWFPGPAETDVRDAHQRTRIDYQGRRLSAVGYITKQMTPQAWYGRGLIRKAGGPILGRRGGTTSNIAWRAREEHFRSESRKVMAQANSYA